MERPTATGHNMEGKPLGGELRCFKLFSAKVPDVSTQDLFTLTEALDPFFANKGQVNESLKNESKTFVSVPYVMTKC